MELASAGKHQQKVWDTEDNVAMNKYIPVLDRKMYGER